MNIFVDENETFPVCLYFTEERDEDGNLLNVEVSEEEKEGWEKIETEFCQPSAGSFSEILEQATVLNDLNQKPLIKTSIFRDLILYRFMKKWNRFLDEEKERMIPINPDNLYNLHVNISNGLFLTYIQKTKMDIKLQTIIKREEETNRILGGR